MPTKASRGRTDLPYGAGSDLAGLTRELRLAHEAFVSSGRSTPTLRPVVLDSWRRCLDGGVDPDATPTRLELDDAELARVRAQHPLFAAMPTIRRLLVESAAEAGMLVAVSDAAGRLLWVEGSRQLRSAAEGIAFLPGANWSEASAGTNAPGTALALDRPVQIFGAEHLSRPVSPWSCSAAPVHDPATGALLGVLDLTGGPEVASPQGSALVRATVAAVEAEFRLERLTRRLHTEHLTLSTPARSTQPNPSNPSNQLSNQSSKPVTAVGADVAQGSALSVLGRRGALLRSDLSSGLGVKLSLRHSELVILLAQARDGLSAEELAVQLSEQEMPMVTVRAEMSRLRSVLSALPMGSRPYRLLRRVHTDVDDVSGELRAGRLRSAVALYAGPVLPRSEAPGVIALREALHHELRRALLDRGDPDALLGFADTDHGRHDLEIWEAALATLPPGSPRRAQVASHCEDLRISLS